MKKYLYIGKEQMAFTLGNNSEYILQPGDEVELPCENKHIQVLEAMKLIQEIKITKEKTK